MKLTIPIKLTIDVPEQMQRRWQHEQTQRQTSEPQQVDYSARGNGKRKLTASQVRKIRRLVRQWGWVPGDRTQRGRQTITALAERHGVGAGTISQIVRGKTYKHVL